MTAASTLSLASSALSLSESKDKKEVSEETSFQKRYKPVWYECSDVLIDLTQVKAIKSWHYLRATGTPRGVRFIMNQAKAIDTQEMSSTDTKILLNDAKRALSRCTYIEI